MHLSANKQILNATKNFSYRKLMAARQQQSQNGSITTINTTAAEMRHNIHGHPFL